MPCIFACLDADDVGDLLDEGEDGFLLKAGGELREVVEQDGERRGGGNIATERIEILLLVGEEAGHGEEQAVDCVALGDGDEFEGEGVSGGSYAAEDMGSAIASLLDGGEDDVEVGGRGEAELAGGSIDGEGGDVFAEEEMDEDGECGDVDGAIGEARGEDSNIDAGNWLLGHLCPVSLLFTLGTRARGRWRCLMDLRW